MIRCTSYSFTNPTIHIKFIACTYTASVRSLVSYFQAPAIFMLLYSM